MVVGRLVVTCKRWGALIEQACSVEATHCVASGRFNRSLAGDATDALLRSRWSSDDANGAERVATSAFSVRSAVTVGVAERRYYPCISPLQATIVTATEASDAAYFPRGICARVMAGEK